MNRRYELALFLLAVAFPAPRLAGQSTFATITGTVTDPNGAMIPKAAIEAVQVSTNYRFTAETNEVGQYTLPQLPRGGYVLTAKAAGFQDAAIKDIVLSPRDERRIDVRLSLSAVQTSVEVAAGATLIETETARIADSKTAEVLNSLPLSNRGTWYYLQLTPQVTQQNGAYYMRFAGSRFNQSDTQIDGATIMVVSGTNPIGPLMDYTESVQELRLEVASNSAEYATLGQINLISKSGTNVLHGSAFDYYRSPVLRARNPFALSRPTGVSHLPGFTVGGPVYVPKVYDGRNKTFFFSSMELSRSSASKQLFTPTVPLAPWRTGDFSALLPGTVVRDPFAGNTPFPNNRIPADRLNPVALKLQEFFYPEPNFGDTSVLRAQNYRLEKMRPKFDEGYFTERVDHRFSDKAFVFGRYTYHHYNDNGFDGSLPAMGIYFRNWTSRAVNTSYTHSIRPTLVNEVRWGLAFHTNPRTPELLGGDMVQKLGLTGLMDGIPNVPGMVKVAFSGLGITGISQSGYRGGDNWTNQFQEHLSWFRGRHTLKFGAMVTHAYSDTFDVTNFDPYGSLTFSNRFTGHPYADFLLGVPTSTHRDVMPGQEHDARTTYGYFANDEFRMSSKLTMNLGLRYEYTPGWTGNMLGIFDLKTRKIVVPDGNVGSIGALLPRSYVEAVAASEAGLPNTLIRPDRNNFAPRLGFAYRPWNNNTVFRGGVGVFYDYIPRLTSTYGGTPYGIRESTYTNPAENPTVVLPRVSPPANVGGPPTVSLPTAYNPDLRIPYSLQYNATVEHQRWSTGFRLSYVGTATRQGEWSYNLNQPAPDTRPYIEKARMFPQYGNLSYYTNGAGHQYHSLTIQAMRQMKNGVHVQTFYTLARDIGDLERGEAPENAYNRTRERAVWTDIPTHRWNMMAIYQLPFGRGKRFASGGNRLVNLLVGHWEVSSIYSIQSGQFLTPSWTGPDPTGTRYTTNRTAPNATLRPDRLRNGNLPAEQRSLSRWFDPSAFTAPQAGAFGTSAKNVILGPGSNIMHAALTKDFRFTERIGLHAQLAATNVLNHPNWSNPATNISSAATVGVITGVAGANGVGLDSGGPRSMRLLVKMVW